MRLGDRQLSGKRVRQGAKPKSTAAELTAKVANYCPAQWQDFAPPLT